MIEAAQRFPDYRLPELFCGFDRTDAHTPVPYPVACSPQAWAAGSSFLFLETMLGLRAHADRGELELLHPHLPDWLGKVTLTNLRVGDASRRPAVPPLAGHDERRGAAQGRRRRRHDPALTTRPMTATRTLLEAGTERLRAAGSDSPRLDAELLLAFAIGVDRTAVIAHGDAPVGVDAEAAYLDLVARRESGEPVAYIRGIKEFHGIALTVDARALIPRPETELLVDQAIDEIMAALTSGAVRAADRCSVVDVGTGSGAIAVALAVALRKRGVPPSDVGDHGRRRLAGRARPRPGERGRPRRRRSARLRERRPAAADGAVAAVRHRRREPALRPDRARSTSSSRSGRAPRSSRASPSTADPMAWRSSPGCSTSCHGGSRKAGPRCSRSARTRARPCAICARSGCRAGRATSSPTSPTGRGSPCCAGRPPDAGRRRTVAAAGVDPDDPGPGLPDPPHRPRHRRHDHRRRPRGRGTHGRGRARRDGTRRRGVARDRPDGVVGDAVRPSSWV